MMTETQKIQQALVTGWHHGCLRSANGRLPQSFADARARFPAWSHDQCWAYLRGEEDAFAGDPTRWLAARTNLDSAKPY